MKPVRLENIRQSQDRAKRFGHSQYSNSQHRAKRFDMCIGRVSGWIPLSFLSPPFPRSTFSPLSPLSPRALSFPHSHHFIPSYPFSPFSLPLPLILQQAPRDLRVSLSTLHALPVRHGLSAIDNMRRVSSHGNDPTDFSNPLADSLNPLTDLAKTWQGDR